MYNYAKINWFQPINMKIMTYLWIRCKDTICIDFVHKIMFLSNFRLDNIFLKGRGLKTASAGVTNLVSKVAQDLKVKSQRTARSKNFARRTYSAKCRGGGHYGPPPALLGLKRDYINLRKANSMRKTLIHNKMNHFIIVTA